MPKMPNIRDWEPTAAQAKHVDQTKMLDTEAKEPMDTVNAENSNTEYTEKHPAFGELGVRGRN